jgi:hypothetical protein
VNGEAVAQVMQTRLMSGVGGSAHDIGTDPQAAKGHLGAGESHLKLIDNLSWACGFLENRF